MDRYQVVTGFCERNRRTVWGVKSVRWGNIAPFGFAKDAAHSAHKRMIAFPNLAQDYSWVTREDFETMEYNWIEEDTV